MQASIFEAVLIPHDKPMNVAEVIIMQISQEKYEALRRNIYEPLSIGADRYEVRGKRAFSTKNELLMNVHYLILDVKKL